MSCSDHYQKYSKGMKNPFTGKLLERFIRQIRLNIIDLSPSSMVDVGCGDGTFLQYLNHCIPQEYIGIDNDEIAVDNARKRYPQFTFLQESIYSLPLETKSQDIVLCLEVLEHLEDPGMALKELSRVAKHGLIVSVPWEPWFQLGNLFRGKHLLRLGNHPEHIQHWTRKSFETFLTQNNPQSTRIRIIPGSWPWIISKLEY